MPPTQRKVYFMEQDVRKKLKAARTSGDGKREKAVLEDLALVGELRARLKVDPLQAVPDLRLLRKQALSMSKVAPQSGGRQPAQMPARISSGASKQLTEPIAPGAAPHVAPFSSAPLLTLGPTPAQMRSTSRPGPTSDSDDWLDLKLAPPEPSDLSLIRLRGLQK